MNVNLDLRRVLPKNKTIAQLAKAIGGDITENELNHLMDVNAKTINQVNLNKVINYLIREELVNEADLPDVLFSIRYDSMWPLLTRRRHIGLAWGFRRDEQHVMEVVSAADSILQCNLLYKLTHDDGQPRVNRKNSPRQTIDPKLVKAWDFNPANHKEVIRVSTSLYRDFSGSQEDRAWVLIGSGKSNPLVDLTIANCFTDAKAFTPEDVEKPGDRSCPFMLRYRAKDPKPPSCCGGEKLSKTQPGKEPGLYYEVELGKEWDHIPSDDRTDSALVFYRFDHQRKCLEMVLGGFSGRATQCLAEYLRTQDADKFWPPIISDKQLELGVFVVKFTFRPRRKQEIVAANDAPVSNIEVIPLAKEVLAARIAPAKKRRRKPAAKSTNQPAAKSTKRTRTQRNDESA